MRPAHLFSIIAQMLLLGAGLSSAQAAGAPSGSLIVNGSFEDPVIAGSFQLFSSIPGWQPTGSCGNIEIDRNAFGAAAEGNQSIELNTTCLNGVSQAVATTPGASYSLAFAFAARPGTTAAQNRMDVRFDGSVVGGFPSGTAVVVPITGGIAGPPQPVPGAGVLKHLSCPSATSCFAIGRTNDIQGVVVPITNGVAGPAQVVAGTDYLNDIACPSPGTCVIAGGLTFQSVGGFVVAITDGTAGPVQLVSPNVDLYSIACTDASHCVAVGDDVTGPGSGIIVPIDDGVAGSYQAVPGTGILSSVSCSTSCVAVGADSSFNFAAILPVSGGVPGSAQYVGGASVLWELTCGTGGCMAVGDDFLGSVGGFLTLRPAATPTIATLASLSVPAGGLISDSATLTGGFAPTGNVTFTLYGPGDATCSNAIWSTTVPVGAGGVSNSGDVAVGAAGTYNWVATYSGDLNNPPVRSECGSEAVVITPQTLLGRAYGLSANATLLGLPLINQPPTPDTGEIATTLDSSTSVPCVATLSGPLLAHALCARR